MPVHPTGGVVPSLTVAGVHPTGGVVPSLTWAGVHPTGGVVPSPTVTGVRPTGVVPSPTMHPTGLDGITSPSAVLPPTVTPTAGVHPSLALATRASVLPTGVSSTLSGGMLPPPMTWSASRLPTTSAPPMLKPWKGKAPPVDSFSGSDPELRLDDWLPALNRAAEWNGWTAEEQLLQLAGHLQGRALQEWNLIEEEAKDTMERALHTRLETGSRMLVAQDFRHITQKDGETVNDFICRLEYTFRVAYGRDTMSIDTRNALLYGQLQEGLLQEVMRAPAVSGAQGYSQLCIAAKNEEKRMAELRKCQTYHKSFTEEKRHGVNSHRTRSTSNSPASGSGSSNTSRKSCYNCGSYSHLQKDCTSRRTESKG